MPTNLCSTVGAEYLAERIPGGDQVDVSSDQDEQSARASCTFGSESIMLRMEVYRFGATLVADAQTRAREYLDGGCAAPEAAVTHGELGDAMCVRTRGGFGQLVEADIGVQRGADVFRVVHSNQAGTPDGTRSTASEIAQLMMGALS